MKSLLDLVGQRFGRLTVLARINPPQGSRNASWRCICQCGTEKVVAHANLSSGRTTSCGCYRREFSKGLCLKHGQSDTLEFGIWTTMLARCTNPNAKSYPNYGGRGIRVCERWRESFENFLADMNDRGYEPGNCRWATRTEQNRNTRRNVLEPHEPAQIRWLASEGYSNRDIAIFFGVSRSSIVQIVRGAIWAGES